MAYKKDNYIAQLDGIRGLAAFWIFYSHFQGAILGSHPFSHSPNIAIDIFMLLSGFLIMYQWIKREAKGLPFQQELKIFYLRRFFRIAPLYYALLIVSYVFRDYFLHTEVVLNDFVPQLWIESVKSQIAQSHTFKIVPDILSRITFIFGLIPSLSETNIIPDWSIGLEMQFYFLFPFLFLFIRKVGWFISTLIVIMFCYLTFHNIGVYANTSTLIYFPQPSFLGFKMQLLMAGMLMGSAYAEKQNRLFKIILATGLMLFRTTAPIKVLYIIMLLIIFYDFKNNPARIPSIVIKAINVLSGRLGKFMGNTSYGVYLVHNLLMFPLLHFLFNVDAFVELSPVYRYIVSGIILFPTVYGISWILTEYIEKPGVVLGRKLIARITEKETPLS